MEPEHNEGLDAKSHWVSRRTFSNALPNDRDGDGGNRTRVRGRVTKGVYRLSRCFVVVPRGPHRPALRGTESRNMSPGGRDDPPGLARF